MASSLDLAKVESLPELPCRAEIASQDLDTASTLAPDDAATVTVHETDNTVHVAVDIEHMPVADDPRTWSVVRKNFVLFLCTFGSVISGLAQNIQTPAIEDMEAELSATPSQISLSISLFLLCQGVMPLIWSAISEVKGRRAVYISSLSFFTVGSIIVAASKSISLVIGFRCLQAGGSSAVSSIGAATLADIFDSEERGSKIGIYYIGSLLGPSAGALLGGALTTGFGWRGPFYFLAILAGFICLCFLFFFKDTFRRERSHAYQSIVKRRLAYMASHQLALSGETKKPVEVVDQPPNNATPDLEKGVISTTQVAAVGEDIKLSLMDVNPFKPMAAVLLRPENIIMLLASGSLFGFCFMILYTTARTLGTFYEYDALRIGLVLVVFGLGNITGSVVGGRWSDHQLMRLTAANGGKRYPEMRLRSTIPGLVILPFCIVGYAWIIEKRLHIASVCTMLFLCGFFVIFVYTCTLSYIIDANVGRSSTATALLSFFRGMFGFLVTEIADGLGDGWTYTIIASVMIITGLLVMLVMYKGASWRARAEERRTIKQMETVKEIEKH
ncbi:hypothetical protein D9758_007099 [Tetrapyrgos nigripes]|uniref:Major facilitator superfamily (MFS) profile domain-containing protein n=1 Tax=Tetrapyrgos nigripes TaxID=182062 RepID=A0A8H5GDA1_9AGAR|nr:hypothetical protein D9758_007099 [Tetrapyrgos nigripes]